VNPVPDHTVQSFCTLSTFIQRSKKIHIRPIRTKRLWIIPITSAYEHSLPYSNLYSLIIGGLVFTRVHAFRENTCVLKERPVVQKNCMMFYMDELVTGRREPA
jgi:hypothetical protein